MQCACFQLKFKRKNRQNTGRFCGKAYSSWCAVFIQTLKLGLTIFITNWKNCLTPIRSLSSWADFCVPELIIEFLSWSLSSWADHWVPELIIVFLSWLLYSWADHCDPELIIEFLSWLLCTLSTKRYYIFGQYAVNYCRMLRKLSWRCVP